MSGPPSLQSRAWRIVLFTGLYLYQGLVAGFATVAVANHYAGSGADAGAVGLHLAVVGVPWVLQPLLWGPLLDRAGPRAMGAHRFWLVLALIGAQLCLSGLLTLSAVPGLAAISVVLCGHSLFAALADTATDRMLMRSVPERELGRTSAGTRIGFVLGSALGAAGFAGLLATFGFRASVLVLLCATSLLALIAGCVREAPDDALLSLRAPPAPQTDASAGPMAFGRRLLAAFATRDALRLLAICFGVDFALALFQVPFSVAMVQQHGWDAAALSRLQAALAFGAGTLGAAAIGLLVDRAGPERALRGLFGAGALVFLGIAGLIAAGSEARAGPAILGLSNVVPALLYVALLPAVVLASRARDVSATQFQIFMATMNLGDVAGAALAGTADTRLAAAWTATGVALVFLACGALSKRDRGSIA